MHSLRPHALVTVAIILGACAANPAAPAKSDSSLLAERGPTASAPQPEPSVQESSTPATDEERVPATTAAASTPAPEPEMEPEPAALPDSCAGSGKLCTPHGDFTDRLCQAKYPDVALYMLAKGSPWTRGYVRYEEVDAVNTIGGPASDAKLTFAEEVIILRKNGGGMGNMQVSGMGSYHVLRWDGTCATLTEHELVTWIPGMLRAAPLTWRYLSQDTRSALLANRNVKRARKAYRKQCRGRGLGRLSPSCQRAVTKLNDAVVLAVRLGTELPQPERRP